MVMRTAAANAPFFVVGCHRSGTTLLQVLLDSHPEIAIPTESHVFERFADTFSHYGDLSNDRCLMRFVGDLLSDAPIKKWGLKVSANDFCRSLNDRSVRGVLAHLFQLYAKQEGKSRWGDKTPQHTLYLPQIKAAFPEARFIHLVRDGRDVAESLRRVSVGPNSIYRAARRWRRYMLAFHQFKSTLRPEEYLEVHYEDLVRHPGRQLERICRLLDLRSHFAGQGRDVPDTERAREVARAYPHLRVVREPISEDKVGIYKSALSARKIAIFESIAGDALKLYGYPMETDGSARVTSCEHVAYALDDYVMRYLRKFSSRALLGLGLRQIRHAAQWKLRRAVRGSLG